MADDEVFSDDQPLDDNTPFSDDDAEQNTTDEDSQIDAVLQDADFAQFMDQSDSASSAEKPRNIDLLMDVQIDVSVEIGQTNMRIQDILKLGEGSLVELNRFSSDPVDILVNGQLLAKGEVCVVDDKFAVKILDIIDAKQRIQAFSG